MNTERIEQLLDKYFEGETSLEEEKLLRDYFKNEEVPEHLQSYRGQFAYAGEFANLEADEAFDPFKKVDERSDETASPLRSAMPDGSPNGAMLRWTLRIAAGLILLLAGFSAGLLVSQQNGASGQQVAALQQEIQQMKMALVYGSDPNITASERISAVNLSARMPEEAAALDREITDILIYTLNNDANANVREAAAEALFRFRGEPRIRKALVNSLSQQEDPLMQLTLINMLVELKERSAINEMQKMLMDSDTQEVVKTRLRVGIAELKI